MSSLLAASHPLATEDQKSASGQQVEVVRARIAECRRTLAALGQEVTEQEQDAQLRELDQLLAMLRGTSDAPQKGAP